MYHYVFIEGDVSYRWEFDTFHQVCRVTQLLAKTQKKEVVYYQRFEWPLIMNFPLKVVILPEGCNQFHLIRPRYMDSYFVREQIPTFKAIAAGYEPCPICFEQDGTPIYPKK